MLLDCLMQLHMGENSADAVAESQGLGSVAFGFMTFNARKLSRRYHNEAVALAQRTGNPAAFAAHALCFLDFYDGRWDEADANFVQADAIYREAGDLHRAGGAVLTRSMVVDMRGGISLNASLAAGLARDGQDSADPQLTSWGHQVLSHAELATGKGFAP